MIGLVLSRLICSIVGHDWADPLPKGARQSDGEIVYTVVCERCETDLEGIWQDIEDAGAWRHYRSPRL